MKRDAELVRTLLLEAENHKEPTPKFLAIDGVDQRLLNRHLHIMHDAGLIDIVPRSADHQPYGVIDLTWEGHELLAAIKDKRVWARLTDRLSSDDLSALPLSTLRDIGLALLKQEVAKEFGLTSSSRLD